MGAPITFAFISAVLTFLACTSEEKTDKAVYFSLAVFSGLIAVMSTVEITSR